MKLARRSVCLLRLYFSLLLCFVSVGVPCSASAEDAVPVFNIRGMDMNGYGRILLSLPDSVPSQVKLNGAILVWTFDRAIIARVDKLPIELSQYVSGAKLDPDGKTLRLALAQTLKFNLQDAGNDYYLDLLPRSWTTAPPPLPAEIVRELSRRVRQAEAILRARDEELIKPIEFEVAEGQPLSLLRILSPSAGYIRISNSENEIHIELDGRYRIDRKKLINALPKSLRLIRAEQVGNTFVLSLEGGAKFDVRSYQDDRVFVIEFRNRISGILNIDSREKIGRAETTGSVDVPDKAPEKLVQRTNQIRYSEVGSGLDIDMIDDVPIASFSSDGHVFVLLATDEVFSLPENNAPPDQSAIVKFVPVGSGHMKGVMLGIKAGLYPSLVKRDGGYRLLFDTVPPVTLKNFDFLASADMRGQMRMIVSFSDAASILSIDDPETGASFFVVPSRMSGIGMRERYRFQEFAFEPSVQGLAIRKFADPVKVTAEAGAITITRPRGLAALSGTDREINRINSATGSFIKAKYYTREPDENVLEGLRALSGKVSAAEISDKLPARLRLARYYAAHSLFPEAVGTLEKAYSEHLSAGREPHEELELLLYRMLAGDGDAALARLSQQDMHAFPDASLLMAYHYARNGQMGEAIAAYRASGSVLASYPAIFVARILPPLAEAAVEAHDMGLAANLITALAPYIDDQTRDFFRYVSARYLDQSGESSEAATILNDLKESKDRAVSVRARLALVMREKSEAPDAIASRLAVYQGLQTLWRGDWIEARIVMEIARLAFKIGDWRRGFLAMQVINREFSDTPGARTLLDTATAQLELLFDDNSGQTLKPIDAVSLFMDFREFMPVGRRGDEVIRKLTDRLVDLDLLPQAAELMRYQIDNRLEGAVRASAISRLAYLYLLDKRAKDALVILNETRTTGLSEDIQRARVLLEARARSELGDIAGAFELVEDLSGNDVNRLRAEIAWRAKDWSRAAEMSELAIGEEWKAPEPFTDLSAIYAIRAAIGYILSADRLSIDRIRDRFAKKFGERPNAAAFRFLTSPAAKSSPFESEYALSYKGSSALDGSMTYFREHYLDKSAPHRQATATPG